MKEQKEALTARDAELVRLQKRLEEQQQVTPRHATPRHATPRCKGPLQIGIWASGL